MVRGRSDNASHPDDPVTTPVAIPACAKMSKKRSVTSPHVTSWSLKARTVRKTVDTGSYIFSFFFQSQWELVIALVRWKTMICYAKIHIHLWGN
ncbi:hypothetical protein CEXT_150071 [Caerostris extrusa]|uniref:Uncharacterized protein n=1 Tax=Caerostris extrusa TaxID=172846 RepID=A0AAV4ULX4_CAEEX|nr:hypothetical protein CEXT_150071 [Caerostris extrusa]